MKTEFYTYAYLREDGTPYYIGKGKGDRCYTRCGRNGCHPPTDRGRILILKKNLTEAEAFRHEVYMIALFGRKDIGTGILRNLTDGGEGSSGLQQSSETREKRSQAMIGNKNCLGYRHSDEGKKKIRQGQLGRKHSEERIERNRQTHLGRKQSEETKEKISLANKGKRKSPLSKEHREKIGEANRGRLHWTNGLSNKMSVDCPGEGWVRGRNLKTKTK
jgi:hypothetical protein